MNRFLLIFGILLVCCLPQLALADTDPEVGSNHGSWIVELELNPGLSMIHEDLNPWALGANLSVGLGLAYSPYREFEVRLGVSEQYVSSKHSAVHPYPYVIDMEVGLQITAIRFAVSGSWTCLNESNKPKVYLGAGFFSDVVQSAKAKKVLTYVPGDEIENLVFKDSFESVVPGVQLQFGSRGLKSGVELRYWSDITGFTIPGVQTETLRRSFIGVNFSIFLYNSLKAHKN